LAASIFAPALRRRRKRGAGKSRTRVQLLNGGGIQRT